jgi:hypothetical protein
MRGRASIRDTASTLTTSVFQRAAAEARHGLMSEIRARMIEREAAAVLRQAIIKYLSHRCFIK